MRLLNAALWTIPRILVGLGLLLLIVTFTPLDLWWARLLSGPWSNPKGDVLIVLGASPGRAEGIISGSEYWRAVYSVRAWREGGFKTIVLTGGPPNYPAAQAMEDFLVAQGIPKESIRLETRSRSTRENALFTKPILEGLAGNKVLLTSDFHMYRAARTFRKAGLEVLPRPLPDVRRGAQNPFDRWSSFLILAQETGKIGYYYLRGWI
jgi:uncharacterized SAM-binding protein YcdF (DUF218 family)